MARSAMIVVKTRQTAFPCVVDRAQVLFYSIIFSKSYFCVMSFRVLV